MDNELKTSNLITIRVDELIHWVMKRLSLIVLAGVLFAVAGGTYASVKDTGVPMYQATSKLYVTGDQAFAPSTGSFSLGRQVIFNYVQFMRSRPVLEKVIETLGLNMNANQLAGCVSYKVPSDTCMLEVMVAFPDAQWAKAIVDELIVVSSEYALEVMGGIPPKVFEEAAVPTMPYNTIAAPILKYSVLGGAAGIILAGIFVLLTYFLDTRFHTPGMIEDKLEAPVWGVIPIDKGEQYKQGAKETFVSRLTFEVSDKNVISFLRNSVLENSYEVMQFIAETLGNMEKKVIFVDTNIGNPEWSNVLIETPDAKGLYDYLVKGVPVENIIIRGKNNFDKIVCGSKVINAGELIRGERFATMIRQLKEEYDYVFVDVPPVQYDVTAFAAVKQTETVLWVISAKKTKTYRAKDVKRQLEKQKISLNGLVLTDLSVRKGGRFFKKKYGNYVGLSRE